MLQRWDEDAKEVENGIYFGQLLAFSFLGPYQYAKVRIWLSNAAKEEKLEQLLTFSIEMQKKLTFDLTKLKIRLGPKWFPFNIKIPKK